MRQPSGRWKKAVVGGTVGALAVIAWPQIGSTQLMPQDAASASAPQAQVSAAAADDAALTMVGTASSPEPAAEAGAEAAAGAAANLDAGADADPVADPRVLEAMERDLGLSRDEAVTRVVEETRAATVAADLREQLGDAYAGAYLSADSSSLTVAVTDAAAVEAVEANLAVATVVENSAAELEAAAQTLSAADDSSVPDSIRGWFVDPTSNKVVVDAADEASGREFAEAKGLGADLVDVTVSDEAPQLLADIRGGDPYYINNRSRCSVGFAVEGGFVSAGHCGGTGATTTGSNRQSQGVFRGSSFPGNDYGWIETNQNWTPQPWVLGRSGENVQVSGSEVAVIGASVCRSGSTTGWNCGVIQGYNQTVRYPQGVVNGLTRTNACAEPGDSGGSFISGAQAQGVTSGGNGNCDTGGTTYFNPVNQILERYGLTLVTSGTTPPPPPPPTTAPPTTAPPTTAPPTTAPPTTAPPTNGDACTGYDRSATMKVGRHGGVAVSYSKGRSERAACMSATGPAWTQLYLQRWDSKRGWKGVDLERESARSGPVKVEIDHSGDGTYRWVFYGYAPKSKVINVGLS